MRVLHAKSFNRTPDGAKPVGTFDAVHLSGNPLETEPFVSVVRVKNAKKRGAGIEVSIVDTRGDTVMSSSGTLTFKAEEAEWAVEWDRTAVRVSGDFQFVVSVSGQQIGSFPIKFTDVPK